VITFTSARSQFEVIAKVLREHRIERGVVGVEKAFLHASFYEALREAIPGNLKIADASKVTGELRLIKTDDEVELISRASAIATKTLNAAAEAIKPGTGENEIAGFIEYELRRKGAEGTATSTFVSSGSGTRAAHPPASTRRLNLGDMVIIDLHPRFKGYCSDLAATLIVDPGGPRVDDRANLLLEARDAAIQDARLGDRFSTIHRRYLRLLAGSGFIAPAVPFFNNLHGVGVAANDPPSFWYPFDVEIRSGMVFAFAQSPAAPQSGNFGVRFEDTYVVTTSGVKRLTLSLFK
ncbi:MAG: Xaa-Pro peptidase family protein, partial [Candidatus Bathyarchaeia archaeon]